MRPTLCCLSEFTASDTLHVRPWPDEVLDNIGFDPRSSYVETFWLGILGPSTTWLVRRLVAGLEGQPGGYSISLAQTARSLGLSERGGRSSPFLRAIARTIKFQLAMAEGPDVLAVRRRVPALNGYQVDRLPPMLQEAHWRWQEDQLRVDAGVGVQPRSRLLAQSMVDMADGERSAVGSGDRRPVEAGGRRAVEAGGRPALGSGDRRAVEAGGRPALA